MQEPAVKPVPKQVLPTVLSRNNEGNILSFFNAVRALYFSTGSQSGLCASGAVPNQRGGIKRGAVRMDSPRSTGEVVFSASGSYFIPGFHFRFYKCDCTIKKSHVEWTVLSLDFYQLCYCRQKSHIMKRFFFLVRIGISRLRASGSLSIRVGGANMNIFIKFSFTAP